MSSYTKNISTNLMVQLTNDEIQTLNIYDITGATPTTATNDDRVATSTYVIDIINIFVLLAGVIGVFANGLISATLAMSKQLFNERFNILVLNQILLDLLSSVMVTIIYSLRLCVGRFYLAGFGGSVLCYLVLDEVLLWIGLNGSTANLVIISVDRYLMIVHPIWHKNHVKKWMIYSAVAFTWFDGILLNVPLTTITTAVVDGVCLPYYFWSSPQAARSYGIWYLVYFYVSALVAFVYFYGHILAVVKRRVTSLTPIATTAQRMPTAAQLNASRAEMNVIKTMMTITVLFIICWLPNAIYYFLTCVTSINNGSVYYGTLALALFNVGLNPFIYGSQYSLIKERLKTMSTKTCRLPESITSGLRGHSTEIALPVL